MPPKRKKVNDPNVCPKCYSIPIESKVTCSKCKQNYHRGCAKDRLRTTNIADCCRISLGEIFKSRVVGSGVQASTSSITSLTPSTSNPGSNNIDALSTSFSVYFSPRNMNLERSPIRRSKTNPTLDQTSLDNINTFLNDSKEMSNKNNSTVEKPDETVISNKNNSTVTKPGVSNTAVISNNVLEDILSSLNKIDKSHTKANDDLKKFIAQQTRVNEDLTSKLSCLPEILQKVNEHEGQIKQLQQAVEHLEHTATNQRGAARPFLPSMSADVVVTGVPKNLTLSDREIADLIFDSLGISHLKSDIIDIRVLSKNRVEASASNSRQNDSTISYILVLKSIPVRDLVIKKKREKRVLKAYDVFPTESSSQIYVNEFLPADMYKLRNRAKAKAAASGFKHVWVRGGRIYARRDLGQEILTIDTDDDLAKLA